MVAWAFREARWRLAVGLLIALTTPLWLPDELSARVWCLVGLASLSPWLVLGRDARRVTAGTRETLRSAPRAGRLVLAEFLPPLAVLAVGALVGSGLTLPAACALFAWGFWLVALADVLDRRSARAGAAWVVVLGVVLAIGTAPLWLAGWFGLSSFEPWPSTLAIGLHPAAAALAGAGRITLQDPVFYTWTLSGVVEVRPLGWLPGTALYLALGVLASLAALRAARRPILAHGGGARSLTA